MITCEQCIEDLRPDDPRIRSGRYRMCGCDYCSKSSYYRELEGLSTKDEEIVNEEWTHRQWDYVKQLKSRTEWVEQKIYDLANKKKEKDIPF